MLSSLQPARLSVLALLLASFVLSKDAHKASSIEKAGAPLVAAKYHVVDELHIRQDSSDDSGSGGLADLFPTSDAETTDAEPTSTDAPPSSTEDSQSESSTEPPSSTTSDDPTTTPSDTGATSTPSKTSTDESSKTTDESTKPTKSSDTTTSKPTTTSSPPRSIITSKRTTTAEVTSDGKTYQTTYVATSLIPTNTASPVDDTPEKKDGMSSQTKKTVIGVVVGIGGAIFVALIFIVFWKFWGRRRSARRAQEDDALMMTSPGEKGETSSTTNPFQSTLESYHAPQRPVNASSNF